MFDGVGHRRHVCHLSLFPGSSGGRESLDAVVPGGLRLFCVEHGSSSSGNLTHRAEVAAQDLVGLLLLEFSVLPGGGRRRGIDELAEPLQRLADVAADSSRGVPDLPFLSPLPGQAGR